MKIGLFIVGDEILSGKRQDKHLSKVIELLRDRGMALSWAQCLGDAEDQIAEAISTSRARGDVVLSCGGIGATPDDRTRQAAAKAFGVPLKRHAGAEATIIEQYGDKAFPHRILMAEFPEGAGLIPNPVNRVAGFYVGDHNFVPGFPEMAWPMLEWVLDTRYPQLRNIDPPVEFSLRVLGTAAESDLLELMEHTLATNPGIALSSLPSRGDAIRPRHIEFGIKGPRALATTAFQSFRAALTLRNDITIEDLRIP